MSGARSGQVIDEYARGVPGAKVYVFDNNGNTASLYSDAGLTVLLAQPILSDQFGGYTYYAADGFYTEETWFGGKLQERERGIPVGAAIGTLAGEAAARDAAILVETNARIAADNAEIVARNQAILALAALSKGDPGGSSGGYGAGTFTAIPGLTIAVGQDTIETTGYANVGDGGRARYVYDAAIDAAYVTAHPGAAARTSNGRGYRLDERRPNPYMFTGGGNTGFLNAQAWCDFRGLKMPFLYSVTEALAPGSWALPGNFNDQLVIGKVTYDGTEWGVENDPIFKLDCTQRAPLTYTTYYLSYATGNDANNGTSSGTAVKTWVKINALIGALTAGSNVLVNCMDQNIGYLSWVSATNGFSGRNVVVQSTHASGFTRIVGMREDKNQAAFGWVAHGASGAWKAPAASFVGAGFGSGNIPAQFWLGATDTDGFPIPIVSTGQSAATVSATELTSFWDGAFLYVHLPNGAEPDPFNNWLYSNSGAFQVSTDAGDLVWRNIRFFNGSQGTSTNALRMRAINNVTALSAARVGFDGCYFYGSSANGLGTFDIQVVVAKNCKAAYCVNDLFNTHSFRLTGAFGAAITYYEINCSGHHAGYTGFNFGVANGTSCNGSTGHDGMSALLVGSSFRDINNGSPVCYVNGADVLLYGVKAPLAVDANLSLAYPAAFSYDANTGEGTHRRFKLTACNGAYDSLAAAIQIAGTATDAVITVEKWQGDPHARLFAKIVNNAGNAGGSIQDTSGNVLFKAA